MSANTQAVTTTAQYKKMQDDQKLKDERDALDLKAQMESQSGRRYVWGVLKSLGYGQMILDTNANIYSKVGKANAATAMVQQMKHSCRALFYRMEEENDGL